MERDATIVSADTVSAYFNSHAHVERDPFEKVPTSTAGHFNSHAHVERDRFCLRLAKRNFISTHTLTWSVTVKYRKTDFVKGNFNSHAHVERDYFHLTFMP